LTPSFLRIEQERVDDKICARVAAHRIDRDEADRLVEMFRDLDITPTPARPPCAFTSGRRWNN